MAFILNVGNYTAPVDGSGLPPDYPRCDTPFLKSRRPYPACDCYVREDAILESGPTQEHSCSREHLCHHRHAQVSKLNNYFHEGGFAITSEYSTPQWGISLIIMLCVFILAALVTNIPCNEVLESKQEQAEGDKDQAKLSALALVREQEGMDASTSQPRGSEVLARTRGGQRSSSSSGATIIRTNSAVSFLALQPEEERRRSSANLSRSNSADSFLALQQGHSSPAQSLQDDDFCSNSLGDGFQYTSESKINESMWHQFVYAFATEWQKFSPLAINPLRVLEVRG